MIRRLVLWDIDGTLLRAGAVGREVFDGAIDDVLGRVAPDRVVMSGKTDPLIVAEQLGLLGLEPEPATVAAILERLTARLAAATGEMARTGTVCPGVEDVLRTLHADPRVLSGLLTGNIEANARIKVATFGLERWLDLTAAAYGSDDVDRNALVPIALRRAVQRAGTPLDPGEVWVVGDTPRDLDCALAGGAHCLLVATGMYRMPALEGLGADAVLEDLADTDVVVKLLTGDL